LDLNRPTIASQITFFYYRDLKPIAEFYEGVMGFELVEDQGWAKIYRVNGRAFMGIVDEQRGFHRAQERNAVLLTLVVDDVWAWYEYLKSKEIEVPKKPAISSEVKVQYFFFQDPGGYVIEIQRFLKPELVEPFGLSEPAGTA
jgi:catechol 2,3-dioxygenase-like lactoylglutathione lyase family enzyme